MDRQPLIYNITSWKNPQFNEVINYLENNNEIIFPVFENYNNTILFRKMRENNDFKFRLWNPYFNDLWKNDIKTFKRVIWNVIHYALSEYRAVNIKWINFGE